MSEKRGPGRPPTGKRGERLSIYLSPERSAWLANQPQGASATIAALIDREMEREKQSAA